MKNKFRNILLFAFLILCMFCYSPTNNFTSDDANSIVVFAEEGEVVEPTEPEPTDPTVEDRVYEDLKKGGYELDNTTDIPDKNLYSALMQIARAYIKDNYEGYDAKNENTLWTTMLKNVETVDIQNMDITSLQGIEKIRFDNLVSLSVTNNSIVSIQDTFMDRMGKLENLNLACNKITTINFGSNSKLKNINLSSNSLSKINFSQLTNPNLVINIANNKFSAMSNIGLPARSSSIDLNIINNNITSIDNEYFESSVINLKCGLQGVVASDSNVTIDTSTSISYYKAKNPLLSVKIYKVGTLSDELIQTITDADVENNVKEITLGVGEYYAEYFENDAPLYVNGDSEKSLYKTYKFKVIPSTVGIKYEYKGKMYDTFENKVTGKVKVYLSCEDGGTIYYKIGNGEWVQGDTVNCDKGGNYAITAKVVIDGVESKESSVLIKTSLNVVIPDIVMLILVLIFTLAIFLIIVPLVSKKWFRK